MKPSQIIAIIFIVILIVNVILLALRLVSETLFWIILAVGFIASYLIKRINEKKVKKK